MPALNEILDNDNDKVVSLTYGDANTKLLLSILLELKEINNKIYSLEDKIQKNVDPDILRDIYTHCAHLDDDKLCEVFGKLNCIHRDQIDQCRYFKVLKGVVTDEELDQMLEQLSNNNN